MVRISSCSIRDGVNSMNTKSSGALYRIIGISGVINTHRTGDCSSFEFPGVLYGEYFGIHEEVTGMWNLTHLPTGGLIGDFNTELKCYQMMILAEASDIDWNFVDIEYIKTLTGMKVHMKSCVDAVSNGPV